MNTKGFGASHCNYNNTQAKAERKFPKFNNNNNATMSIVIIIIVFFVFICSFGIKKKYGIRICKNHMENVVKLVKPSQNK